MDAKFINPFIDAFTTVLPQMGFQEISRCNIAVREKSAQSLGVAVLVGITKQIRGNVAYNMPENTAKFIASTMMCGMPVDDFDDMAQSAIAEMANMLTATAATNLSAMGHDVDISTPSVTVGNGFSIKIANAQYLCVNLMIDNNPIELNIAIG